MMEIFCSYVQPAKRMVTKKLAETTEPWSCTWMRDDHVRNLFVPKGYIWDGASVPRIAWSIVGITPFGAADGTSLTHDALYRAMGGDKPEGWKGCTLTDERGRLVYVTRNEADQLMRRMFIGAEYRAAQATVAYRVVDIFGPKHWGGPIPALRR